MAVVERRHHVLARNRVLVVLGDRRVVGADLVPELGLDELVPALHLLERDGEVLEELLGPVEDVGDGGREVAVVLHRDVAADLRLVCFAQLHADVVDVGVRRIVDYLVCLFVQELLHEVCQDRVPAELVEIARELLQIGGGEQRLRRVWILGDHLLHLGDARLEVVLRGLLEGDLPLVERVHGQVRQLVLLQPQLEDVERRRDLVDLEVLFEHLGLDAEERGAQRILELRNLRPGGRGLGALAVLPVGHERHLGLARLGHELLHALVARPRGDGLVHRPGRGVVCGEKRHEADLVQRH